MKLSILSDVVSGLLIFFFYILQNSMDQCVPVRVVRGHECKSSYVGKVYTYDGLYKVIRQ